jgi:hypothetical protein
VGYGLIFAAIIVAIPFVLHPGARPLLTGAAVGIFYVMTALMLFTAWWAHRNGIPNNADLRSLVLRSTADQRFWKRPQLAQRLLPVTPPGAAARSATDYVRRLSAVAQRHTSGPQRELALKGLELARVASRASNSTATPHPGGDSVDAALRELCERLESLGPADASQTGAVTAMIESLERQFAGSSPVAAAETLATHTRGPEATIESADGR